MTSAVFRSGSAATPPDGVGPAAPLGVWVAAAAVAAWLALTGIFLDRLWPGLPPLDRLNLARLERPRSERPLVVVLGDSKVRFAVEHDAAFLAPSSGRRAPDIDFVRITQDNAGLDDLRPALEALQRQPPALLLLQSDLLLTHRGRPAAGVDLLGRWRDNVRRVRRLAGGAEEVSRLDNWGGEGWRLAPADPPVDWQGYAQVVQRWRLKDAAERAAWLSWVRPLQAQGTRVRLLEVPRSPRAQTLVPPGLIAQEEAVMARLATEEGLSRWSPPPLQERDYLDSGHLAKAGQARYSDWLRQALSDGLHPRAPGVDR